MTELRRRDDERFAEFSRKMLEIDRKVTRIERDTASLRELLITEPEASPLGRSLLYRARENREMLDKLRHDFELFKKEDFRPLDDWWNQSKGAWRLVLAAGIILGIVSTLLSVLAFVTTRAHP